MRVMTMAVIGLTGAVALSALPVVPAAAQQGDQRDFTVAERFDSIALNGSDSVRVVRGARFAITATGERGALDALRIEARGGTLSIGRHPGSYRDRGALVTVTMPALAAATIAGSGDLDAGAVSVPAFTGEVRGSGNLRVGPLRAGRAELRVRGSGDAVVAGVDVDSLALAAGGSGSIRAAGRSGAVALSLSGSGDIDAQQLQTSTLSVAAGGSGGIRARSSGTATGSARGSGSVAVTGGARCAITRGGTATVRCG